MSPSFTMNLHGVEFCLEPDSSFGANIDFKPDQKDNCIIINLSNFTGNLKVFSRIGEDQLVSSVVSRVSPSPERKKKNNPRRKQKKRVSPASSASNSVSSDTKDYPKMKKSRKNKNAKVEENIYEDLPVLPDDKDPSFEEESMLGELPYQDVEDDTHLEDKVQLSGTEAQEEKIQEQIEEKILMTDADMQDNEIPQEEIQLTNSTQAEALSQYEHGPSPRWGHTVTRIDNNRVVVYGGQDDTGSTLADIYIWSSLSKCWSKPVNVEGVKRQWHSTVFLKQRQLVICFGGEAMQKGRMTAMNEVMVLDTEIMLWYPPSVTGLIPSGRSGHSANVIGGKDMVIFGGVRGQKWQNSVAVLDTTRWKWSSSKVFGDAPRPRSYHSATTIVRENSKHWIVVFGGNDAKNCFNTVHVLEIGTDNQCTWINPLVSGELPAARTGHAATLLKDGSTILIHGGWDPNSDDDDDETIMFRDSYLLDTKTWNWTKTSSQTTQGRVGHSALLNGNHVQVFGGRLPGDEMTNDWLTIHQDDSKSK